MNDRKVVKRSRCRVCGEMGVKAKHPVTGFKKLFTAIKVNGVVSADLNKPHVCSGPPVTPDMIAKVKAIVQEELKLWMPAKSAAPASSAPAPSPAAQPSTGMGLHSAVAPVVPAAPSVTTEQIAAIVEAAVAVRVKPIETKIVIVQRNDQTQVQVKGHTHPLFPRLMKYIAGGRNVYLYGAPGGGKSYAAFQVAEALGLSYGYISLAPMTPESRLFGFYDAHGKYVETPFYHWYKDGGVFCIDEMDNSNDALLTSLNGALENKRCAFPCGVIERSTKAVMVATGNTAGYGGTKGHAGRRAFDAATRERFAYIRWTYDEKLESDVALAIFPKAETWIQWVRSVRAFCSSNYPDVLVSPRASINGAEMLKSGSVEGPEELADALIFKGLEEVQRSRILSACPLPYVTVETEAK